MNTGRLSDAQLLRGASRALVRPMQRASLELSGIGNREILLRRCDFVNHLPVFGENLSDHPPPGAPTNARNRSPSTMCCAARGSSSEGLKFAFNAAAAVDFIVDRTGARGAAVRTPIRPDSCSPAAAVGKYSSAHADKGLYPFPVSRSVTSYGRVHWAPCSPSRDPSRREYGPALSSQKPTRTLLDGGGGLARSRQPSLKPWWCAKRAGPSAVRRELLD